MNGLELFSHPWHNTTTLHPIGVGAIAVLGIAMLAVPRRWALVVMLVMACFVSPAQRVVVMSIDLNMLRIMILAGWLRIALRGETRGVVLKPIDGALIAWAVIGSVMMTILYGTGAIAMNRLGHMFDVLGMYFLVRCVIRTWDDVASFASGAAFLGVPVAIAFLVEKATGRNYFSVFGGVPEFTAVRQGKLRCQGAFAHPILAGVFWASLMPLITALWWRGSINRMLAVVGIAASVIIVLTCSSSTPVIVVMFGALVCLLFPLRASIRWFGIGGVVVLGGLHFVMHAPVWHLLARVDVVGGSTGWYRYKLIDAFITNFNDWWLTGTTGYAGWFEWGLADVTNQYVAEGVNGGLITLLLFLTLIVYASVGVARAWRVRGLPSSDRLMAWMLFTSIMMHCVAFLAVSYFGQSSYLWYIALGLAGCAAPAVRAKAIAPRPGTQVWQNADTHAAVHKRGLWA